MLRKYKSLKEEEETNRETVRKLVEQAEGLGAQSKERKGSKIQILQSSVAEP